MDHGESAMEVVLSDLHVKTRLRKPIAYGQTLRNPGPCWTYKGMLTLTAPLSGQIFDSDVRASRLSLMGNGKKSLSSRCLS